MIDDEVKITKGMWFDGGFVDSCLVVNVKNQSVEFGEPLSGEEILLLRDILIAYGGESRLRKLLVHY
jgi:methionine aminopeptidase